MIKSDSMIFHSLAPGINVKAWQDETDVVFEASIANQPVATLRMSPLVEKELLHWLLEREAKRDGRVK